MVDEPVQQSFFEMAVLRRGRHDNSGAGRMPKQEENRSL